MTYNINDEFTLHGSKYRITGFSSDKKWYHVLTLSGLQKTRIYKPIVDLTGVKGLKTIMANPIPKGKKLEIAFHKAGIKVKTTDRVSNVVVGIAAVVGAVVVLKMVKK